MSRDDDRTRWLLSAAIALGLWMAIGGCGDGNNHHGATPTPTVSPIPETFADPPEIDSVDGVLDTTMTVQPETIMVGEQEVTANVYYGLYTPPTWRLRSGDILRVKLENMIDMTTNLHTHGLNVSPMGDSDNIFLHINPTESFSYEIKLPDSHPPGTFYYHPHIYGTTEFQIGNGMSGGIIVDNDEYPPPSLRGVKQRTMLLKDIQMMQGQVPDPPMSSNGTTRSVNGLVNPTIVLHPGETELWRILNIGADIYYDVQLDGHVLQEISRDGNSRTRPIDRDHILIPTSARVDVVVSAGAPGLYLLNTLPIDMGPMGDYYPQVTLATVVVEGPPATPAPVPTKLPAPEDLRGKPIAKRRKFVFSENMTGDQFCINNMQYDPSRTDTTVQLGDIEEWTIQNCSGENHVFHIHQLDFQVIERDGVPQEYIGRQDTVNLPYTTTGDPTTTKVLLPFTDPVIVGRFVYHCHIGEHEDNGMMQNIEVVDEPVGDAGALAGLDPDEPTDCNDFPCPF